MIINYLKTNKFFLLFLIPFVLSKSIVKLYEFPPSLQLIMLRSGIFIVAVILTIIIVKNPIGKLITIILIVLISLIQGSINTFDYTAEKYLNEVTSQYETELESIIDNNKFKKISYHNKKFRLQGYNNENDIKLTEQETKLYSSFFEKSDFLEVEKNEHITMFILSRFIDNGYGLANLDHTTYKAIKNNKRFRLNGYEIRSLVNIADNWYYISFT